MFVVVCVVRGLAEVLEELDQAGLAFRSASEPFDHWLSRVLSRRRNRARVAQVHVRGPWHPPGHPPLRRKEVAEAHRRLSLIGARTSRTCLEQLGLPADWPRRLSREGGPSPGPPQSTGTTPPAPLHLRLPPSAEAATPAGADLVTVAGELAKIEAAIERRFAHFPIGGLEVS